MARWTFVYRMYDEAGDLIYVGVTGNLLRRLYAHGMLQPWEADVVDIRIERFESESQAYAAEHQAIKVEKPRYNIARGSAHHLTAEQRDERRQTILRLYQSGLTNKEVAERLGCSSSTVSAVITVANLRGDL